MKLLVFTKEESPETRAALELAEKIEQDGYDVEYLDANDVETTSVAGIYDVYSFPTFIVTSSDGILVEEWKGLVPLESDLRAFLK